MTYNSRLRAVLGVAAALIAVAAPGSGGAVRPRTLVFGAPIRVSPEGSEAWEPSMLADRFGNIFIHARKATSNLVVSTDDRSETTARSRSWLWTSGDQGASFANMPGYPLGAENHEWGYEGDFALDDRGHLYFVDQTYADSTFSRWTITGRGAFAMDLHRPLIPTAQPLDDRPFLAAHGDGKVFYIVNTGDATLNPTGRDGGDAYGAGRFSIYRSTDGGASFDPIGHSLKESGACRHAADHRSAFVYVICTNDGGAKTSLDTPHGRGTLWAYVSPDDGATYTRHVVGDYNADAETYDWPLVTVGPTGDIWALHIDAAETKTADDGTVVASTNSLNLYHSSDRGSTWSKSDITPERGPYRWGTLVSSATGELAFAVQHRPDAESPWKVYVSVFEPGKKPVLSPVDTVDGANAARPPSELVGLAFLPDRSVGVSWTRVESRNGLKFLSVYFARSSAPASVEGARRTHVTRNTLPSTGAESHSTAALAAILGALITRRVLVRANRE